MIPSLIVGGSLSSSTFLSVGIEEINILFLLCLCVISMQWLLTRMTIYKVETVWIKVIYRTMNWHKILHTNWKQSV